MQFGFHLATDTYSSSQQEVFVFIEEVVYGIQANLQRLYDLGLRNVMVANMFDIDCMPHFSAVNGYTKCASGYLPVVQVHNAFLLGVVKSINANNPGARFILLDQYSAFNRLIADAGKAGFTSGLKPCCVGTSNTTSCGDVDASGKWLYTVCKHRGNAIFWDDMHPTMWAWHYIVELYANDPHFVLLADAPTLKQWLQINDAAQEPVAAPTSPPGKPPETKLGVWFNFFSKRKKSQVFCTCRGGFADLGSAAGQVQAAFNYLLDKPQYSEALGLLQSLNLDALLSQHASQVVTVFLPRNDAFTATDKTFIDRVFAKNKVNDVASYHVAKGYFDLNAIVTGKPSFVTSLLGQQVPLFYPPEGIFVGLNRQAKVIDANLYTTPGQMVIHGIDHVLMPSGV